MLLQEKPGFLTDVLALIAIANLGMEENISPDGGRCPPYLGMEENISPKSGHVPNNKWVIARGAGNTIISNKLSANKPPKSRPLSSPLTSFKAGSS